MPTGPSGRVMIEIPAIKVKLCGGRGRGTDIEGMVHSGGGAPDPGTAEAFAGEGRV